MKNIIKTYKNNIKTIIKNFTGSENEDLEQEVYVKTWKNIDKYKEQNKFKKWISTITANVCRDYLKSSYQKNKNNFLQEEETEKVSTQKFNPENEFEKKIRQKKVAEAILKLPQKLQEAIVLFEIEGQSYEQIAEKINCPTGTVKSRIFNARKQLSISLQDLL